MDPYQIFEVCYTGPTTVSGTAGGNIGLHPGDDPTIETFPGQEEVTLSGTVQLFDAVAEQAKVDLLAAYNDAAGRSTDETIAADLGGKTLTPGVYTSASSIGITGMIFVYPSPMVMRKEIVIDIDHEAEMPQTGGNAPLTTYWGLILFGTGLLMRRKRK